MICTHIYIYILSHISCLVKGALGMVPLGMGLNLIRDDTHPSARLAGCQVVGCTATDTKCVYVCVYIYIYAYIHIHIHIQLYIYIYVHTYTLTSLSLSIYIYIYIACALCRLLANR